MILNKILRNQIKKLVKELIGTSDNKWELRKIQNEQRSQRGEISRLKASKCKCKCKCKEENA